MGIPENQWGIIWKAVKYWMDINNLSPHYFSHLIAGTQPPYLPDRISRGIKDGSEEITPDFLHRCIRIFGLTSARQRGLDDKLTDQECVALLTAPLRRDTDQGKFQL